MKVSFIPVLSSLVLALILAVEADAQRPSSWGGGPVGYRVKIDAEISHSGDSSVSLSRTTEGEKPKFGTIVQAISASSYTGKRIRFSGFIKSRDAKSGGLWLRVDSENRGTVGFDNMKTRRIEGTKDWDKYDIVLDVADDASVITFGALLSGAGTLWIDDLSIAEVNDDVDTTVEPIRPTRQKVTVPKTLPDAPQNMDFEA